MPDRSRLKLYWHTFLQHLCRMFVVPYFRFRCFGQEHVPKDGGALLISNHQSLLDPVLLGVNQIRPLNYLARSTLFKSAAFGWLIRSLEAIPIEREGRGMAGLKETLRRLKQQRIVVVFPEGTRTPDGEVREFKPGFIALARRGGVPLLPAAIDGAAQAWPRKAKAPRPGKIVVVFGEPIPTDEIEKLSDEELIAEVQRQVEVLHATARAHRDRM